MFTVKETTVLKSIIDNLYAEPGFSDVTADQLVTDDLDIHAVGGVVSSLQKKGVIWVEELSPKTGHLGLGENGEGITIIYLNDEAYKYHKEWAEEEGIEYEPLS